MMICLQYFIMIWTSSGHHLGIIWTSFEHHLGIICASFGHQSSYHRCRGSTDITISMSSVLCISISQCDDKPTFCNNTGLGRQHRKKNMCKQQLRTPQADSGHGGQTNGKQQRFLGISYYDNTIDRYKKTQSGGLKPMQNNICGNQHSVTTLVQGDSIARKYVQATAQNTLGIQWSRWTN